MKNYKDETIAKLCQIINCLDDYGCLTDDEVAEYKAIMADYAADKSTEDILDKCLPDGYACYSNCYILRSREDGEIIVKSYDKEKSEVMMRDVSKQICFSDCDDIYDVIKIIYQGREVEYDGWRPRMVMTYFFKDTGNEAWSGVFEQWDH